MTKNSGIEFLTRTPNKKKLKEIRLLFPDSYPAEKLKEDFNTLIKQTKKGARKSSLIATTLAPFALVFDVGLNFFATRTGKSTHTTHAITHKDRNLHFWPFRSLLCLGSFLLGWGCKSHRYVRRDGKIVDYPKEIC